MRLRQEVEWAIMVVLVLIGIGLLLHPRPKMRLFGPAVGCIAYWALAFVMAVKTGWLLPMVAPTLGILAPPVAYYAMRSREERSRREEIEHRFGRSVSPRLVDWYLAQEETIPDQEEREVTILFFDVRGSTNLGSTMEPRAFHRRMNELLGPVSEILERHEGLISRYTGDGFLAFFNAPNDVPNHAIKALFAATEIITYVQQHNQKVSESQRLGVGCGLNTGIVSCGMLGQASRAEYTVLGDVINVAAKLEALNKDNQTELTISASVAAATQEHLQAGVLPLTLRVSADQPIGTRPLEDENGAVRWVPRRFAYFGYNVKSI